MKEFQQKKRWRWILNSKLIVAILIIATLFMARATYGLYKKERETSANVARAENQLKTLQNRDAVLSDSLERLHTEEGIEEEIRSKYSVSKPGEELIVIVNGTSTATTTEWKQEGWWGKFKQLFK